VSKMFSYCWNFCIYSFVGNIEGEVIARLWQMEGRSQVAHYWHRTYVFKHFWMYFGKIIISFSLNVSQILLIWCSCVEMENHELIFSPMSTVKTHPWTASTYENCRAAFQQFLSMRGPRSREGDKIERTI
jgi:hypothetical protein